MKTLASLFIAIVVSLTLGCDRENTQAAGESNSRIQQEIESRLNADRELSPAKLTVDADTVHNQVTLSGTVNSEELRNRAVELAKRADPGAVVDSKINVIHGEMTRTEYTEELARQERDKAKASMETIGDTLDDAWIHSKVLAQFLADALVAKRNIHVDVKDNVVTLRGTVSSEQERADAEKIAMETHGVTRVINQLKIQP